MTGARAARRLVDAWYRGARWLWLLWPLALVLEGVARGRRWWLSRRWRQAGRVGCPVMVVGNITLGGTGKSPLVMHLIEALRELGYRPGVVSRGYGGRARAYPVWVDADSDPGEVGDEPLMIARATGAPLVVDPDRVRAARSLCASARVDWIIADDGLQHYRLQRDLEIAVIDGARGLGNARMLPMGPLREPPARLTEVDALVVNGELEAPLQALPTMRFRLTLEPWQLRRVDDPRITAPLQTLQGREVRAWAGIGHPQRFFDTLAACGARVEGRPLSDHEPLTRAHLGDGDRRLQLMTDKDAVKCRALADERCWSLALKPRLEPSLVSALAPRLSRLAEMSEDERRVRPPAH